MNNTINIALCLDDKFAMPTGVLIKSIELTTKTPIHYHLIYQNLSEENKLKLSDCVFRGESALEFHQVSNETIEKSCPIRRNDHVTKSAYLRLLIPEILTKCERAIYIDGDMICAEDLSDLYNYDLEGKPCGVVVDIVGGYGRRNRLDIDYSHQYFCSALLLMDLNKWRESNLGSKTLQFIEDNPDKCVYHDQDALNVTLMNKVKYLPIKYSMMPTFFQEVDEDLDISREWIKELEEGARDNPVLIHFCVPPKPWEYHSILPFRKCWIQLKKTTQWKWERKRVPVNLSYFIKHLIRAVLRKWGILPKPTFEKIQDMLVEKRLFDKYKKLLQYHRKL